MNNLTENLKSLFNSRGFNLFNIIESRKYDILFADSQKTTKILQNTESIIIVGFMGNKFWDILMKYIKINPHYGNKTKNIIDEYSISVINESLEIIDPLTTNYKTVYPFGHTAYNLDFSILGKLGGIGVDSLLGLLINPEYGTWISFRGAILSDLKFEKYDNPIDNFAPCHNCSKPCIVACPADTISNKGWYWKKCLDFRVNNTICNSSCYSRKACPYGIQHQYSYKQFQHHHDFVLENYITYTKKNNGN